MLEMLSLSSTTAVAGAGQRNQPAGGTRPSSPPLPPPATPERAMPSQQPQQYELERIVGARSTKNKQRSRKVSQEEYRVRWKGWSAADDTWEDAAQLRREVPHAVKFYEYLVREAAARERQQQKRQCAKRKQMRRRTPSAPQPPPRARCQRELATIERLERLSAADARATLLTFEHRGLFDLMRRQFPTTPPSDIAQIISESQCCLVIMDGGTVTAGAACSYDAEDGEGSYGGSVSGYLHFLASDVRGQKHGSALLYHVARYLQSHGARKLLLDSQRPDDVAGSGRKRNSGAAKQRVGNDPVAFYRACGMRVESSSERGGCSDNADSTAGGVPMAGSIDEILHCCAIKLGQTQHVIWLLTDSGPEPPYSGFGDVPMSSQVVTQSIVKQLIISTSKSNTDGDDGTLTPVSPAASAAAHAMHQQRQRRPRTSGRKRQAPSLWQDDPLAALDLGRDLNKQHSGPHREKRRAVAVR